MAPSTARRVVSWALLVLNVVFLFWYCETTPIVLVRHPSSALPDDSTRSVLLRNDFASFLYACRATSLGRNMYDTGVLNDLAVHDKVRNPILPYLYPPFFAVVGQPLTGLAPETAQRVWDYLQILAAGLTCVLVFLTLCRAHRAQESSSTLVACGIVAAVVMFLLPFRGNLEYGQMNILIVLFLSVSFFLYFRGTHDVLAGVALGVAVLLKVTPALFVLFFLFNRRWRVLAGFAAGTVILILSSIALAGIGPWLEFLDFLPSMGYARIVAGGFLPSVETNFSIAGFFLRVFVGEPQLVRVITFCVALLLLGALLVQHLRYGHSRNEPGFILSYTILMVIASPVAWKLHLVSLFPGMVLTLWQLNDVRKDSLEGRGKAGGYILRGIASVIMLLSVFDFPSVYHSLAIPENVRPFVTSMNLVFLVAAFFFSITLLKEKGTEERA